MKENLGSKPLNSEEFKTKPQKVEEELGAEIERIAGEEEEGRGERKALLDVMGPEKATEEQIYKLRKEINKEEEQAERIALVKAMGPEKATKKQSETFRPVDK
ncbi:MAG: hypothetical protein V1661_00975 [bacterium]